MIIRHATDQDITDILRMMKAESHNVGFIPMSRNANYYLTCRCLLVNETVGKISGYLAYTRRPHQRIITIQQVTTHPTWRRMGYASRMVRYLADQHPGHIMIAKVREDLPANAFWTKIGFTPYALATHHTSGNPIFHYFYPTPHGCDPLQ